MIEFLVIQKRIKMCLIDMLMDVNSVPNINPCCSPSNYKMQTNYHFKSTTPIGFELNTMHKALMKELELVLPIDCHSILF